MPPSSVFTDGDNAQQRYTGDCRADQGARDAPGRGPRENGDDGQYDQIQTAKKVELLRSHRRVISHASRAAKIRRSLSNTEYKRETGLVLVPSLCWD